VRRGCYPATVNLSEKSNIWAPYREDFMSALAQKRTYAVQNGMSALHPITTAKVDFRKRSCPLYPRSRHVRCS